MKFLEWLQSLDDATKRKVLVVATAIIMVVVIYLWLAYFNNLVTGIASQNSDSQSLAQTAGTSTPQTAAAAPQALAAAPGASIWTRIGNGFADMYSMFQAPRQYNIQPQ